MTRFTFVIALTLSFLPGCISVSINYSKELAKALNEVSSTKILTDGQKFYVKKGDQDIAYGPEGKEFVLQKKGSSYYIQGESKVLEEVTSKYVVEMVSGGFKELIDIKIEENPTPVGDDLYIYTIAPKYEAGSQDLKEFVFSLNQKIRKPQELIIDHIRNIREQRHSADSPIKIYSYLGQIEEDIREAGYDRSIFRIPILMELYYKIKDQAYGKGLVLSGKNI